MVGFLRSMVLWFQSLRALQLQGFRVLWFQGFTWVFGFRGWYVRVLGSQVFKSMGCWFWAFAFRFVDGFRVLEYWGVQVLPSSGFAVLGSYGPRSWGSKVLRCQGLGILRCWGFRVLGSQGILLLRFSGFMALKSQGLWLFEFECFWAFKALWVQICMASDGFIVLWRFDFRVSVLCCLRLLWPQGFRGLGFYNFKAVQFHDFKITNGCRIWVSSGSQVSKLYVLRCYRLRVLAFYGFKA